MAFDSSWIPESGRCPDLPEVANVSRDDRVDVDRRSHSDRTVVVPAVLARALQQRISNLSENVEGDYGDGDFEGVPTASLGFVGFVAPAPASASLPPNFPGRSAASSDPDLGATACRYSQKRQNQEGHVSSSPSSVLSELPFIKSRLLFCTSFSVAFPGVPNSSPPNSLHRIEDTLYCRRDSSRAARSRVHPLIEPPELVQRDSDGVERVVVFRAGADDSRGFRRGQLLLDSGRHLPLLMVPFHSRGSR